MIHLPIPLVPSEVEGRGAREDRVSTSAGLGSLGE